MLSWTALPRWGGETLPRPGASLGSSRLYLGCISAVSRLYLGCISAPLGSSRLLSPSRLHLGSSLRLECAPEAGGVDVVVLYVVRRLEDRSALEADHRADEAELYVGREGRGDAVRVDLAGSGAGSESGPRGEERACRPRGVPSPSRAPPARATRCAPAARCSGSAHRRLRRAPPPRAACEPLAPGSAPPLRRATGSSAGRRPCRRPTRTRGECA